jgi:hypothetical protein
VPALPPYIIEPIFEQFAYLLPETETKHHHHPLGCHRRRISDRVVFEKLVQVLVFGCAYERIAAACLPQRETQEPFLIYAIVLITNSARLLRDALRASIMPMYQITGPAGVGFVRENRV